MFHSPLRHLLSHTTFIIGVGLLTAALSFGASFLLPLEYRADAQVLIISKSRYGVDPYTVVKSAERIGENIAQVMKTDDFYKKVIAQSGYTVDTTRFEQGTERQKRKRWEKTIHPSVVYGTGVLNVSTYSTDPAQAMQLAAASVSALVQTGWEYVGGDVIIKIVNQPIVTRWPARPNIPMNIVLGFVVGSLFAGVWVMRKT